ncbi:MAG: hypothetical protein R6X33_12340 [Candidatus Brocadiia bacterium]
MSELTQVEKEQEAPTMREPATGPLLPRWFKVIIYLVLGSLAVFAISFIGRSFVVQHRLTTSTAVLKGDLEQVLPSFSGPRAQQAVEVLARYPVDAFLYLNQEILQDEEDDPRMARALALRKATEWGTISTRRDVVRQLVENMDDEGHISKDVLSEDVLEVLWDIVADRRAVPGTLREDQHTEAAVDEAVRALARALREGGWINVEELDEQVSETIWAFIVTRLASPEPLAVGETAIGAVRRELLSRLQPQVEDLEPAEVSDELRTAVREIIARQPPDPRMTYAEHRITEVLLWLARGAQTMATGVERRRMESLLAQYEKKSFVGTEAKALGEIIAEWSNESDEVARQAAEDFQAMLQGEARQLSPEAARLCYRRADALEDLYQRGIMLLCRAGLVMLEKIVENDRYLDHPHIYQYLTLLGKRFDDVRQTICDGIWLIRTRYYTIRFLSYFASKTSINPVMAVETVRLTREEHERLMRRANNRRMRESVQLLIRIGLDYMANADQYAEQVDDQAVRRYIIHTLEVLRDDERVDDLVAGGLSRLREADKASPAGPRFFTEED